jgi:hypothetical protein
VQATSKRKDEANDTGSDAGKDAVTRVAPKPIEQNGAASSHERGYFLTFKPDLIGRELVRRSVHPDDARHFQLWPTAAGRQAH